MKLGNALFKEELWQGALVFTFPAVLSTSFNAVTIKLPAFFDIADYKAYLHHLKEAAANHSVAVHAFVLMTNHVHLLATPQNEHAIGLMMQAIGRAYVPQFNFKYDRTGTLWEGRYKATIVESERYLLTLYRYIEANPVRAGMVTTPADYPWSSYQANANGKNIELLTPHPCYLAMAGSDEKRRTAYKSLFGEALAEEELATIRSATNKAWVLGGTQFKQKFETTTKCPAAARTRGGDRRSSQWREQ